MSKYCSTPKTPAPNELLQALREWQQKHGVDVSIPSVDIEPLETKVLKSIAVQPTSLPEVEAKAELNSLTSEDYDRWFLDALDQRKRESIQSGYGELTHSTERLFTIGIESIKQGKPSTKFLDLLDKIAKKAEEKDVMAYLFPDEYPKQIKKTTIHAARRDAKLVRKFKEYIAHHIEHRVAVKNGKEGLESGWYWKDPTYRDLMRSYKSTLSPDESKALDRALIQQGTDVLDLRRWVNTLKG